MINTILWDVDGTLLDFDAAERAAIRALFTEFNLGECTDAMIRRYSEINKRYWQRLERGEITKKEVLIGRFNEFFESEGIDCRAAEAFNAKYQLRLGDTIVFHDDSLELVKALRGKVKQYVVSNGTVEAQSKKLRLSGLGELMDGVFLSEHIGAEKPSMIFFDKVFEEISAEDKRSIMIVGDSLTSDIQGGNNAGIITCWYNPHNNKASDEYDIDYEISNLHQIYEII